jgi:tetratricopeptide (TPR) repeat protein
MNRRISGVLLVLVAAGALWYDLARLQRYESIRRFNRGVAHYRAGEFSAARDDFAAVSGNDSALQQQSLYNQGNCNVRLAEQNAVGNRAEAEQLYRTALKLYRAALQLVPEDRDALANQHTVTAVIAGFAASRSNGQAERMKPSAEPLNRSTGEKSSSGKVRSGEPAATSAKSGQSSDSNRNGSGNRRKSMGREQAERLLNEKRGQEAVPSAIKATSGGARLAPPVKDW